MLDENPYRAPSASVPAEAPGARPAAQSRRWTLYVRMHALALAVVALAYLLPPKGRPLGVWQVIDAFAEFVLNGVLVATPLSVMLAWKALRHGAPFIWMAISDVLLTICHWALIMPAVQ